MRNRLKFIIFFISAMTYFGLSSLSAAHINPKIKKKKNKSVTERYVNSREDCQSAQAQIDMSINNVRARLLSGGDVWWDLQIGKYVVPKTEPGQEEVSSIFNGAVWLGGLDPAGNLKIAAVNSRRGGNTDYFSGPIDPITGSTNSEVCENWDRFFQVFAVNVKEHNLNFDLAQRDGTELECDKIPEDVRNWPGKGNPFFEEKFGFELPNTGQGLGSFWDEDQDGLYNPCQGDFPIIDIRGCEPLNRSDAKELVPDEMTFWIYNDAGGAHTQTLGTPILMEVQVQAFAFTSNDEINDMTFQRYKLINRASSDIRDTYFAMYIDPDLGCHTDDYIGCNVERSLAYVYNEDALDGQDGCTCPTGVNTYCSSVPMLGVDYFRGPLAPKLFDTDGNPTINPPIGELGDTLIELGMSSFIYYNNGGIGSPETATTDPTFDQEYYNFLRGIWKDGTPITFGDDGYNPGSTDTVRYTFPNAPTNENGWSMCTAQLPFGDRRILQASGPFLLKPQAINELIIGVTWVPDVDYPCPDITRLLFADDLAQGLFDNCFEIIDGPDAPDVDLVELDQELVLILSNDEITSNNAREEYEEQDLNPVPEGLDDTYNFEGYQLYQLSGPNVTVQELNDVSKARIIRQVDIKNEVSSVFNWEPSLIDPTPNNTAIVWTFQQEVQASNTGIKHTFNVTDDSFASGDTRLINHRTYYFLALAYAHNNWQEFDPADGIGQRTAYLSGRRNIKTTRGTPRPIVYQELNTFYGDGPQITRIQGIGTSNQFLEVDNTTYEAILNNENDNRVTYKSGRAPIEVLIYNPLEVKEGKFRLSIEGDFNGGRECKLLSGASWKLENLDNNDVIFSDQSLDIFNEQIIREYGFSINIGQVTNVGEALYETTVIGSDIEYTKGNGDQWLKFIGDQNNSGFDFLQTELEQNDNFLDPIQQFSAIGEAKMVPFILCDYVLGNGIVSPGWKDFRGGAALRTKTSLRDLNNVDIIMTSDKSKWSRCVIVETSNKDFESEGYYNDGEIGQFDLRDAPSVGKEDNDGDGKPDPDGDGTGMGWFPGYALDVETGNRLNIFFGENSTYNEDLVRFFDGDLPIGSDMLFNPTSQETTPGVPGVANSLWNSIGGGQHFIYVTRQKYDECALFRERLSKDLLFTSKRDALKLVTWTGLPLLNEGSQLLSYKDGLIPTDVIIKLRVQHSFNLEEIADVNSELFTCNPVGGLPIYEFELKDKAPTTLTNEALENPLKNVNVVPNPYYGISSYETNRLDNVMKITNLPPKCTVSIYSLDGSFIRRFNRDERGILQDSRTNPPIKSTQPTPDIEWDLKNSAGIQVASGVYLIHVSAPELNAERTLKWFGVGRKFDPSGL